MVTTKPQHQVHHRVGLKTVHHVGDRRMVKAAQKIGFALVVLSRRYFLYCPALSFQKEIVYEVGRSETATSDCAPYLIPPMKHLAPTVQPTEYLTDRAICPSVQVRHLK